MSKTLCSAVLLLAGVGFVLGIAVPVAEGAKVKVWHHYRSKDFEKARFKRAVVSNTGVLRLSRQVKSLADIDATHVWAMVEDHEGNLVIATGDEGKLFRVTPDGKAKLIHASKDSQVFSLTQTPEGIIYAGTGPSGRILRLGKDGKITKLAEDLDSYVWSLVYDPQRKMLFAGTGPKGRVYQVKDNGEASVFYHTKQEHILCLALSPQGAGDFLYAGTDKGGMIHRIDAKGKGFVIFHTPQSEIRSLLVLDDAIYAGTGSPVSKRPGSSSSTTSSTRFEDALSLRDGTTFVALLGDDASAPSAPKTGENSLFRISNDGTVRELFRDKVLMLCLLKNDGHILVGTGMDGQLFEVDIASKEYAELARLDHSEIHCMLRRRDGSVVLGTGDTGKLYLLEKDYAPEGTIVSEVLDAKIVSHWGSLTWNGFAPKGTGITLAVRSGNVPEPDATWSGWSQEQSDPDASKVQAPAARYLQYRVTLKTSLPGESPSLRSVAIRYQTTNQPPEITSFTVPDIDGEDLDNPKKLKLKWATVDANEDALLYNLYLKKEGWKAWVLLEENLDKKTYDWDTTAVPAGLYRLKLVVSDRTDNAPATALTTEKISPLVPVAHLPPRVTLKLAGFENGKAIIEGSAADGLVRLTEASFALNGKDWANVFPTDGIFDSKSETFRFTTPALRPGTYILVLRARNAAGSTGSTDLVFTFPPK